MKYCVDCRHYKQRRREDLCLHYEARHLITKEPIRCSDMRLMREGQYDIARCGRDAQWFEPKEQP